MTEFATFTGKNVDEAVNNALLQLQITSEKLEYEVVEKVRMVCLVLSVLSRR